MRTPIANVPLGYRGPAGKSGRAEIDPVEAEVVQAIFERYATGRYSHDELADGLGASGHRGRRGEA